MKQTPEGPIARGAPEEISSMPDRFQLPAHANRWAGGWIGGDNHWWLEKSKHRFFPIFQKQSCCSWRGLLGLLGLLGPQTPCRPLCTATSSRRRDCCLSDMHGLKAHPLGHRSMLVRRSLLKGSCCTTQANKSRAPGREAALAFKK